MIETVFFLRCISIFQQVNNSHLIHVWIWWSMASVPVPGKPMIQMMMRSRIVPSPKMAKRRGKVRREGIVVAEMTENLDVVRESLYVRFVMSFRR